MGVCMRVFLVVIIFYSNPLPQPPTLVMQNTPAGQTTETKVTRNLPILQTSIFFFLYHFPFSATPFFHSL